MTGKSDGRPDRLAKEFCGLQLRTPIVLPSGRVGFGEDYTRRAGLPNRHAGAVVLTGPTRDPRHGYTPLRTS